MDTVTHVVGTIDEVSRLIGELRGAISYVNEHGECSHVRSVFEQAGARGPWRITITIVPDKNND